MKSKLFKSRIAGPLACSVALLLLSACNNTIVSWDDGVNVLTDGSFEDGTDPQDPNRPFKPLPAGDPASGTMKVPAGSSVIPGWTVVGTTGQDVAWAQNDNKPVKDATTAGSHFVDLTGLGDKLVNGHFTAVRHSFSTVAGFKYHLSFIIGIYPDTYPGPVTVTTTVSGPDGTNYPLSRFSELGKQPDLTQGTPPDCGPYNIQATGPQWRSCDFVFQARSTNATLTIDGTQAQPSRGLGYYLGLDKVSVDCMAPLGMHYFCSSTGS